MAKETREMVIKFWIQTDRQGSLCEDSFQIDDEEWGNLSEEEKEEMCRDAAFNYLEWGWSED